jgi:DNA polymerase-4
MRRIIHLDLDAFYASVEQRDRPELRGLPVLVGGSRERGVVCACSYEARRFGVHSAMAMARAVRLCPQAVVLPVRMSAYREASEQVFAVFSRFTDRIEPISLDEAFLDVTGCETLFGPALEIARRIKAEVRSGTGLTVSAGVASNKFLAKLASDLGKPDGLLAVSPEEIDPFLLPLPVSRIWGVGGVTARKLDNAGLRTVADLRSVGKERLVRLLGSAGEQLFHLALGEDDRPVEPGGELKSVGHEETFEADLRDTGKIRLELLELAERVARRLRRKSLKGRCVTLKVKYADFQSITRSATLGGGVDRAGAIHGAAMELLKRTEAGQRPVRLLGISLTGLEPKEKGQAELFGREKERRLGDLDRALDRLRDCFGEDGIRPGSLLEKDSAAQKGGDPGKGT